jgi:hypothetical protein
MAHDDDKEVCLGNHQSEVEEPAEEIRRAAIELARTRGRPCLTLVLPTLRRGELGRFCDAVGALPGPSADVVLFSHGGDIDTAYAMARELRRRVSELTVFVPLCAKSAATLLALSADELVLGPLGELGPLDAQFARGRHADAPSSCSELVMLRTFEQLGHVSLTLFHEAVGQIAHRSDQRPLDVASKAAELVSSLMSSLYGRIDPLRLAEAARALEVATEYGTRLLRRYRPDLDPALAAAVLDRLVHAYPCHGFPLDLEELTEIGLPVRAPADREIDHIQRIARALLPVEGEIELIEATESAGASCASSRG